MAARWSMLRFALPILLSSVLVATSVPAEPVKVAVLLGLSGLRKGPGTSYKEGFLLGLQEEASAHQVDWKSWITLEFLDTRQDKDHTLQLAKDAIAGGAKAIVGPDSSGIALHVRDYLIDAGVPWILPGTVHNKLRTKHPLFIRLSRSIPLQSLALADWLKANPIVPGAKPRWACIHSDYAYGVGACNAFKQAYGEVGEEIGRVPVPLKTVNMKKEIVQLAKLKPDFALAVFSAMEAQVFVKDYYRFKVHQNIPLVSVSSSMVTPQRLQAYEKTLEQYGTGVGLISLDTYIDTIDTPVNKHFVALVQQTYNTLPSFFHLWGYDAGRLLIKALVELDGKWDDSRVVQLMKTLPYTSPRQAQPLRFDSHGDVINGAYILQIKREGNRLVRDIIAEVPPINLDEVLK